MVFKQSKFYNTVDIFSGQLWFIYRNILVVLPVWYIDYYQSDICIRYSTIETKEAARIGYNGFLFPHSYSGDGLGARMRKKKLAISRTGKFFCFNNNVSNLYNNSVVAKIYGMAYIFTLLMFRKPNKITINKKKRKIFIGQRPFDSRLYLDISRFFKWKESFIFRYFKVFQVSQMFTCGLSDLLLLAVGSLVVFCIARIYFKSSHTRQFWT